MKNEEAELVFISSPVMGHIAQAVELAKLMIGRDNRLFVTFLLIKLPIDPVGSNFIDSVATTATTTTASSNSEERIRFIHLPSVNDPDPQWNFQTPGMLLYLIVNHHKPHVRDIFAAKIAAHSSSEAPPLAGLVVDMLCTPMIDVATEFGVPSYVFFTSNAAFLGLMFHFQTLHDDCGQDIAQFNHDEYTEDLIIPSYAHPVPPAVLPLVLVDKQHWTTRFLHFARGYRKAKAIIVNTFSELESHALNSLPSSSSGIGKTPPIYPVGPILNRIQQTMKQQDSQDSELMIMEWLDDQAPSSVVFLCFGSRGTFPEEQVREIARGVEQCGYRFLWSLKQPPPKGKVGFPGKYAEQGEEVLPEGFLDRTVGRGKVVNGWVNQLSVLSHPSVGGFLSHCGWNSVLESLWCGVPIATWPLYAEQQINAFQLVREFGLAVDIYLDYQQYTSSSRSSYDDTQEGGRRVLISAAEISSGIRRLMETTNEVREKVKEMGERCRMATREGGSSFTSLGTVIDQVIMGASPAD